MAELIDAEMLILRLKAIRDFYGTKTAKDRAGRGGVVACICAVHDAQRIEAEPIRRGRWREISAHRDYDGDILRDYECTECLGIIRDVPDCWQSENLSLDRYCSMCGAKMDGGAENDA